jgi:prepilin-type N-terminal cleavage/methylation domain-containing protein
MPQLNKSKKVEKYGSIKGFTLIELLVAISVLAIASAVGFTTYANAQIAGRDAKRKDDMRQVQTALELYFQSQTPTHFYPNGGYSGLSAILVSNYINQVPNPPTTDPAYTYVYTPNPSGCAAGACTGYDLCARLENTNDPTFSGVTIGVVAGNVACGTGASERYFHLANP